MIRKNLTFDEKTIEALEAISTRIFGEVNISRTIRVLTVDHVSKLKKARAKTRKTNKNSR